MYAKRDITHHPSLLDNDCIQITQEVDGQLMPRVGLMMRKS
jgi:hypothetical protein